MFAHKETANINVIFLILCTVFIQEVDNYGSPQRPILCHKLIGY